MIACSSSVGVGGFIYGTNNKTLNIQLKDWKIPLHSQQLKLSNWEKNILFL